MFTWGVYTINEIKWDNVSKEDVNLADLSGLNSYINKTNDLGIIRK